jgi:ABC-type glutathione transport system ATPase component
MPSLPCYEVTLETKANAINSLLQKDSIVALVGVGGIGKTTLSKTMYHLFYNQYEKSSFWEDVKLKDINDVKKKFYQIYLIKKLHKHEEVNEYLDQIKHSCYQRKLWLL